MNQLHWHRLRFPAELEGEAVLGFLRLLAVRHRRGFWRSSQPVVFELHGSDHQVVWWLGLGGFEGRQVLEALRAQLPALRAERLEFKRPATSAGVELKLDDPFRPVRRDVGEQSSVALLGALGSVQRGEALVLQWLVGPWLNRSPVATVTKAEPPTIWNLPDWGKPVLDSEGSRALRDKQTEPLFGVVGRIAVQSAVAGRRQQLLRQVIGALQVVRAPGVGLSTRHWLPGSWVPGRLDRLQVPKVGWPCVLSASELAGVLGWPLGNPVLSGVSYRSGALLPAAERLLVRQSPVGWWD